MITHTPDLVAAEHPLATARRVSTALRDSLGAVMAGRSQQIDVTVATVLAGGHVLIEDVPGVGKTLLAQALAAAIGGSFARVQGTADLLPSDVIGSLTPDADGRGLHFRPGPLFANVVLFDELNRANARTQSALLEVLEEGHVTVDGVAYAVPSPFVLVATQNPVRMAGTYPLAEGVTDRFTAALSLGR
ncbi:MAG TPA: AAA family ATPase, partial [Ilumatobacteraceae bacterium]|nr:AAA family ATPase [Ilumatobacteraceae bacterium]